MSIGRFIGGIAALIWSPSTERYLLLRRSSEKDFASDAWECVTGRVDQGEGFEDAVRREVYEELGVEMQIDFVIGTTHFYRGLTRPENELIGVVFGCSIPDPHAIRISSEHSEHRWVTAAEADALLTDVGPSTLWIRRVIERAEDLRRLTPTGLLEFHRNTGFELG
jgi:8-oxo-dGTP diphosphatase